MGMPDLEQVVAALAFTGVRVGGVMVFAPFTGSETIALPVKATLTLLLTALIYPALPVRGIALDALGWTRIAAGEAVIGLAMGLLLQFTFEAAAFAGQIFGIQAGFSLVTLLDPQTQADSPALSVFVQLMAMLAFLKLNVHHWLLRGMVASFAYLPPGSLSNLRAFSSGMLQAAGGIWLAGLQMAAPVLAATILVEIALGFLGKIVPQLPATLAGLPAKSMLGLAVMIVAARGWPGFFDRQFALGVTTAERLLHLAR